uniref:AB hydrolase-1 domain-containing protein n=1 Tax=Cucumis sativus TaxID=3659 RepID=A0A0A0LY77_CUCSA
MGQNNLLCSSSTMIFMAVVFTVVSLLGLFFQATQLPPPQNNGESVGLSVSSPRIRLRDGRFLAYRERGVSKNDSINRIIVSHGFGSSKDMNVLATQNVWDRLLCCFKFHNDIVTLAGAALIVPTVNYWWPSLPHSLISKDYRRQIVQWAVWLSHYAPGLLYWWITHTWIPSNAVLERNPIFFNDRDIDILKSIPGFPMLAQNKLRERGVFDTLRHDFMVAFGEWGFDPMRLSNPFPENGSSVHIWQGYEDRVVPFQLQRYVSGKLPWIQYHEVPDGGHLIVHYRGLFATILRALLLGEEFCSDPKPNLSNTVV